MNNPAEPIKELTAEKAMKNGTEQPQVCKKFSQEREKAKGFVSNEQKGEKLSTQKIQNKRLSKLHPWCSPAKWYRLV